MRPIAGVICFALLLLTATAVGAQDPCPCVPVTYEWIATACDTWNCAVSAVIVANGDPHVFPLPTASSDYTWVVLRRIVGGSVIASPDAPFRVDGYSTISEATSHYSAIDPTLQPMLVTAVDGKTLVIARNFPEMRRRAVGH